MRSVFLSWFLSSPPFTGPITGIYLMITLTCLNRPFDLAVYLSLRLSLCSARCPHDQVLLTILWFWSCFSSPAFIYSCFCLFFHITWQSPGSSSRFYRLCCICLQSFHNKLLNLRLHPHLFNLRLFFLDFLMFKR